MHGNKRKNHQIHNRIIALVSFAGLMNIIYIFNFFHQPQLTHHHTDGKYIYIFIYRIY